MISEADVRKVSELSHIKITDEEIPEMSRKLNNVIEWVEEIQEVNTEGVKPMIGAEADLILNEDEVAQLGHTEGVLSNAPERKFDFYSVPKFVG
jgi:aspartyl-tRNA(Asn)/glutamyl-tRNA(Gln) amidotransferase subunit C